MKKRELAKTNKIAYKKLLAQKTTELRKLQESGDIVRRYYKAHHCYKENGEEYSWDEIHAVENEADEIEIPYTPAFRFYDRYTVRIEWYDTCDEFVGFYATLKDAWKAAHRAADRAQLRESDRVSIRKCGIDSNGYFKDGNSICEGWIAGWLDDFEDIPSYNW